MIKRTGKIKEMLYSISAGLFGVLMLAQVASAAPAITGDFKKTDETGFVTYQLTLDEDNDGLKVDKLYYHNGSDFVELTSENGLEVWQTKRNSNEVLAVAKVADSVTKLKVTNNNQTPDEAILNVETASITEDNAAPVIEWKYKNETDAEEKYIEFKATDETKIYKLVDGTGEAGAPGAVRVIIEEKYQDTTVIARYTLQGEEEKFYVYDMLGNYTEVNLEGINICYTVAAKNISGDIVVLNLKLEEGATLKNITTVEGIDIITNEGITRNVRNEEENYLVAIYTAVPEGTTYVNVTYEVDTTEYTIPIELELDIDEPIVVKRSMSEGEVVASEGSARAYINSDATKAIVEVNDALSGIVRIAACTGTDAAIVESEEENQTFEINHLPKSVLQLIDLPEDATYIKVVDAVGNAHYIDLSTEGMSVTDNTALTLNLVGDSDGVSATFRDKKVGLEKFVRATDEDAQDKDVTVEDGDVNYRPTNAHDSIQTAETIEEKYPVTEQTVEITADNIQGKPEFTVIDVFGNKLTKSLNDVLFHKDYIMMDVNDDNTRYIAVKVHDERRIKKITATIDEVEITLELFEGGTNAEGRGPEDVCKIYEIGKGEVTQVTIYHYNGEVTQNVLTKEADIDAVSNSEEDREEYVDLEEIAEDKYLVSIKYGIKKLEYSDGCVIEFSDDLPTKLDVDAKSRDEGESLTVRVTDGLGYTYTLEKEGADLTTY